MRVINAIGGADDGLVVNCISQAQPWTPVFVVRLHGGRAVATVSPTSGKFQRAIGSGVRIGPGRVQERHTVLRFTYRRHRIPAQSGVDRKLAGRLPVVVYIYRERVVARTGLLCIWRVFGVTRRIDRADQVAGIGQARVDARAGGARSAADAGSFANRIIQRERGCSSNIIEVVEFEELVLTAEGEGMLTLEPLHVIRECEGVRVLQIRACIGSPLRRSVGPGKLGDRKAAGRLPGDRRGRVGESNAGRGRRICRSPQAGIAIGRVVLRRPILELVHQIFFDHVRVLEDRNPGDGSISLRIEIGHRTHVRRLAASQTDQALAASRNDQTEPVLIS